MSTSNSCSRWTLRAARYHNGGLQKAEVGPVIDPLLTRLEPEPGWGVEDRTYVYVTYMRSSSRTEVRPCWGGGWVVSMPAPRSWERESCRCHSWGYQDTAKWPMLYAFLKTTLLPGLSKVSLIDELRGQHEPSNTAPLKTLICVILCYGQPSGPNKKAYWRRRSKYKTKRISPPYLMQPLLLYCSLI